MRSYALGPTMLPLLESLLELQLISKHLCPFKVDFIFGNSQKSFRAKSGEQGECFISLINFWPRNCLTAPCELEHCHSKGKGKVGPVLFFNQAPHHEDIGKWRYSPMHS
jgi:hypothetical protein